jgi:hypothetical protein
MYYRLFTRVFELIEQRFGFVVRWQHIHGEGFSAMVMDMDTKQLPGMILVPNTFPNVWPMQY